MGKFIVSLVQKILFLSMSLSVPFSWALSEELAPTRPTPYHNLIPRFKMPTGNLLPYRIPQWEVLYFLKYGIVPFIFYDPHFNRTNFIRQVHKFKMYFDEGRPNRTSQLALTDDNSFREFLRKNGYPNLNLLPDNALSQNNKMAEEIDGLIRNHTPHRLLPLNKNGSGHKGMKYPAISPLLEGIIKDVDGGRHRIGYEELTLGKRFNNTDTSFKKGRQNFWNTLLTTNYPSWKYSKSQLGSHNMLLSHASNWVPKQFPYATFWRNTKSFRISTRNANMGSGEADDIPRDSASTDSRRGANGKTFQTQGW